MNPCLGSLSSLQIHPSPLWGEGRVRGEATPRPRQRADHPFGQPVDRDEEQRAVEDEAIVDEPRQQLRQQGQGEAPDHRTRDAAEPPEEEVPNPANWLRKLPFESKI